MDQSSPLCQPSYFNPDHVPAYSSLPSSTAAPRTFIRNTESSESGHTTGLTPKRQGQKPAPLMCHECKYAAKNRSDLKKHNARHERQYRCHYTQCMRKAKGFATKNDLDRHLKSVHHENNRNTEYYRCFAEGCPRAARNWPRLDNFKQHLQKVHKHQDQDHLLKLSEQWYEQQQQRFAQEDGAESNNVDTLLPSGPVTPMMAAQEEYQNNCPAPEHPPDTSMTTDNQMARSLSFDHQLLDPSLVSSTSPGFSMPQRVHRRNVSNPNSASMLQRQFLNPSAYTDNLASSVATMQRTQSQLEYSNYSNDFLLTDSFDPMGNFHFSTGNPWPGYGPLTTMNHSFKYDAENDQIRRVKGPHTVAALESNSLAELTTPQEPPSAMSNDLSGRQEELLLNIGGSTDNTATGASSDTSPNQTFKVNLIPPENQTPIGKLLEDEINAFLLEHSSKSEKTRVSMSQEDIINLVRSSLRSLSTTNASGGGSSAGPSTASPASAGPASKKYPGHEKTAFRCTVEGCSKVLPRQSDLRKHLIRHEKPYGCTSDGCNKTFGSKNDWKRHEQTQHEQLECWLCVDCHEVFYYDQDNYIQHMREAHPVCHPQDGRYNVGQFQIAANHQGHYWCGFCNQIMRHNKHGVDAVNARFDHIGDHFNKDKKAPRSWIELTGRGRRKEESVQKPRDQSLSQVAQADSMRGEADSILSSSSSSSSSLSSSSFSFDGTSLAQDPTSSIPVIARIPEQQTEAQADMSCNTNTKTRAPEVRTQPHRRPQRRFRCADLIICCYCKAPSSLELSSACEDPSCLHKFCSRCTFKAAAATLKE
ncbi:hypothetical protein A1O3_09490 [Capronia epimyces CBS 606.96]|uniref:C2H2-type domain-containing protein n=1 Tax=Capronia epimyces CBS 606.96 TaxID=1182542 RepID=W9Y7G9_9EURO|nr:uncharacterized protein A1O3_09490 [Capronia epimyces CBS 606.96]EXJ78329.1 hypothetical protein A1O3_09490 [Capronia epimyces CBS 606.96]